MEKFVMIIYNEAIDNEVMELIEEKNYSYTKIIGVFGKGKISGFHLGDEIWPARNNILFVGCTTKESEDLLLKIKSLRLKLAKEGLKAFVFRIENFT
ncbi:MAG: hypothetical protein NC918_08420 [Candidatus Omnitrophica bacterium]|nr:hypothetical protein [Candidatus Omnitrophota bacterium]